MTIVQANTINPTALLVPDLYVVIKPPSTVLLNGVPTNILGIVGTATWGPVNSPTISSGVAETTNKFGSMQPRKFDLGTAVAAAALQGAANFRLVRVTDGTDVAASTTITCASAALATAIAAAINNGQSGLRGPSKLVVASTSSAVLTLTAIYTGSTGNSLVANIGPGSAAATSNLTISLPGLVPESFTNMGVATSTASSATFTGGTDGAATITASVLVGQDTIPRKGMYALRNTGTSIAVLADADDSTQWTTQVAFGLSEGIYMIMTGPAGDTIANAVSAKATAGIDSFAAKLLFGDWIYINDNVNNQVRVVSPQGFSAGVLANLSPEQSSLNKQMFGIVGTQKSMSNQVYSAADLQALAAAGIDVITNPIPAGKQFGARIGHNSSSNAVIHGDNYTRMTNYIASTINAGMGIYIGRTMTAEEFAEAKATLDAFFFNMYNEQMIGNPQGTIPWSVVLDASNNPQSQTALGIQQANVKVQYLAINEVFILNIEGGQSVQITRQIVPQ
jgi:uncharacterized protein